MLNNLTSIDISDQKKIDSIYKHQIYVQIGGAPMISKSWIRLFLAQILPYDFAYL